MGLAHGHILLLRLAEMAEVHVELEWGAPSTLVTSLKCLERTQPPVVI